MRCHPNEPLRQDYNRGVATLILGSRPVDELPRLSFDRTFVANGAFSQVPVLSAGLGEVTGVVTPYLFEESIRGGPYRTREPLRQAGLAAINRHQPKKLVIRPAAVIDTKHSEENIRRMLDYEPQSLYVMTFTELSSQILFACGCSPLEARGIRLMARLRRMYPAQDRRWKISTGALAFLLATQLSDPWPILVAGIGIGAAPYPENPAFLAVRASHLDADLRLFRAIRAGNDSNAIKILDNELESATSPLS